ncbi:hypothetical protein ACH5RR_031741 [Cinchona calisaya]|uniref:Uncharacterized protein n=1 Tax=Cinchona calisaya TaxID=153742 RepID=A0ABD2YIW5_9GENT
MGFEEGILDSRSGFWCSGWVIPVGIRVRMVEKAVEKAVVEGNRILRKVSEVKSCSLPAILAPVGLENPCPLRFLSLFVSTVCCECVLINTQVSSKVAGKSPSTTRSDDASSVGPWTRSKSKAAATMTDRVGNNRTKTRTIITLGAKNESSESKKLDLISEYSMSNEVSHDKSLYASDADSCTGSSSKSFTKKQR